MHVLVDVFTLINGTCTMYTYFTNYNFYKLCNNHYNLIKNNHTHTHTHTELRDQKTATIATEGVFM